MVTAKNCNLGRKSIWSYYNKVVMFAIATFTFHATTFNLLFFPIIYNISVNECESNP